MRISNISQTNKVSLDFNGGKVDWAKFATDFTAKINEATSIEAIAKVVKANDDSLYGLCEHNEAMFDAASKGITTAVRKFQNGMLAEGKYALPKNDQDVDNIVKNLKQGIKAGTAGHKLYNTLGDKGLTDLIGVLKTQDTNMDVTAPVVNHVMQMEPTTLPVQYQESVKKLQESILNDARLACMILQPTSLTESTGSNVFDHAADALHKDLQTVREEFSEHPEFANEKLKRLAIRANQIKLAPSELKQYYIRKYNKSNLLETGDIAKATFEFIDAIKQFKDLKKTQPQRFKVKFYALLHQASIDNNVAVQDIKDKYKELLNKAVPVTEGTDVEKQKLYDLAFLIDSLGPYLRWGQTYMQFRNELGNKLGKKFGDELSFLIHEGEMKDYAQNNVQAIFHRLDMMQQNGGAEGAKFIETVSSHKKDILDLAKKISDDYQATLPKKQPIAQPDPNAKQPRNAHKFPHVRMKKRNFIIGKYAKNSPSAHYWFKQVEDAAVPIVAPLVDQPTIELSQVENALNNNIDFRRLVKQSGITMKDAVEHIKNVVEFEHPDQQINEDVVPFTGNKKPAMPQKQAAQVVDMPKPSEDEIRVSDIADFAKSMMDDADLTKPEVRQHIVDGLEHALQSRGYTIDQFLNTFEGKFGKDFHEYLHGDEVSKLHRGQVAEGISSKTAKKCRNDLYKTLRKMVDTSNLSMFSNFESFEDKDKIVLKMAVYEPSKKKMDKISEHLKAKLKKQGWKHGIKENEFIKGDANDGVMISISNPCKTFRSGSYRNREVLTLPIEIFGSKKPLI
jgi:hypothetical protein